MNKFALVKVSQFNGVVKVNIKFVDKITSKHTAYKEQVKFKGINGANAFAIIYVDEELVPAHYEFINNLIKYVK